MLHNFIHEFLAYCRLANFSERSLQALTARINEFKSFLKTRNIRSVKKISYLDLVAFVADFNSPSIHVRKSRVWTLRQFYHFLTLHNKVPKNIATKLPYPKIEKTLHPRLFRHTAATHLNRVAGIDITQHVLGHSHRANTLKYAHLNPDQYAVYMKRHPYMQKEVPCLH